MGWAVTEFRRGAFGRVDGIPGIQAN
jgi:hypothetical protein